MKTGRELTPEELTEYASRVILRDSQRLGRMNYPVYRGKEISPMSSASQRAVALRNENINRPSPYNERIATVLRRPNRGLSDANVNNVLDTLSTDQNRFADQGILGQLRGNFLSGYDPRVAGFNQQKQERINAFRPEAQADLNRLARVSDNLEMSRTEQTANSFNGLRQAAQGRRENLAHTLDQFGQQAHGYNNMNIAADRNRFNSEASEPFTRLDRLRGAIGASGTNEQMHPDLARGGSDRILDALQAYGIDTARPASEWLESPRRSQGQYQGRMVADLPPEITASRNILERLSPNLADDNTPRRKEITRGLLANDNLAAGALQRLPEASRGRITQMERQAQEAFEKDMRGLNNRYIKMGQFGSPQHMQSAEEQAQALNQAILEQRNKIQNESLRDELHTSHQGEIDNLRQLNLIGRENNQQFNNITGNLRNMNHLGATRFANDQDENERMYRNYQNESLWQWPHMRGVVRAEGAQAGRAEGAQVGASQAYDNIFRGLQAQGIGLDDLARLNTNYSNLERERNQYQQELTTMQGARAAIQQQAAAAARQAEGAAFERQRLEAIQKREQEVALSRANAAKKEAAFATYNNFVSQYTPDYLKSLILPTTPALGSLGMIRDHGLYNSIVAGNKEREQEVRNNLRSSYEAAADAHRQAPRVYPFGLPTDWQNIANSNFPFEWRG